MSRGARPSDHHPAGFLDGLPADELARRLQVAQRAIAENRPPDAHGWLMAEASEIRRAVRRRVLARRERAGDRVSPHPPWPARDRPCPRT